MRTLALTHIAANALLLWLGYYWLGIGESRAVTLLWSLLVALVAIALACEQYGAAFVYFRGEKKNPWRTVLGNLPALAVAALAVLVVYLLLARWAEYSSTPANRFASWLTLKFRKPVRPSTVLGIFNVALWLVRWVILPVTILPMIAAAAARGWRGFGAVGALEAKRLLWLEAPLLLLCGLWLPVKVLGWVPRVSGFGWEMVSFVLRASAAYLLFLAAGLALAFVTSRGKPQAQVKTAVS